MFTITTRYITNNNGTGQVVAKANGKQRTVTYDQTASAEQNHGAACGTLLNVLCDDRQQAMLRHPSGGQRVRSKHAEVSPDRFQVKWTVNV